VPEPESFLLLGSGIAIMLAVARSKRVARPWRGLQGSHVECFGQGHEPTPRCCSSCNVETRSATDRPQRSRRHTNTTSISRRLAEASNGARVRLSQFVAKVLSRARVGVSTRV
jgi:hypothetical protein